MSLFGQVTEGGHGWGRAMLSWRILLLRVVRDRLRRTAARERDTANYGSHEKF